MDNTKTSLQSEVADALWMVLRECEDKCDLELEDVSTQHVVWQLANIAIGFIRQARSASRQEGDEVPEGCTPADARMLRVANHGLAAENDKLREALAFYAEGNHFVQHDPDAWDTVSGEPANFYEDESNTATVEDGSVAKMALDAVSAPHQAQEAQGDRHGE